MWLHHMLVQNHGESQVGRIHSIHTRTTESATHLGLLRERDAGLEGVLGGSSRNAHA